MSEPAQMVSLIFEEIATCGCGNTDDFAKDAYKLLFKKEGCPIIKHRSIYSPDERVRETVQALEKSYEPYAYYFKHSDKVFEVWDLLKGVRVK